MICWRSGQEEGPGQAGKETSDRDLMKFDEVLHLGSNNAMLQYMSKVGKWLCKNRAGGRDGQQTECESAMCCSSEGGPTASCIGRGVFDGSEFSCLLDTWKAVPAVWSPFSGF